MDSKLEDLKKDIAELENFQKAATRQRTKNIINIELRKLATEVQSLSQVHNQPSAACVSSSSGGDHRYSVKLNNYAWDQSDKYVKFYVTLKNVHTIPQENIVCNFTEKSLELTVTNLENKDYVFTITNLLKTINPANSSWKVKSDTIIINAAKLEHSEWSHVTELEKRASDSQKLDKEADKMGDDPSAGLMSLMKKMYERGDDEMKRTIAKAWTESQGKVGKSSMDL